VDVPLHPWMSLCIPLLLSRQKVVVHELAEKRFFWHFLLPFILILPSSRALFTLTVHPLVPLIPFCCKAFWKGGLRLCTKWHGFVGGPGAGAPCKMGRWGRREGSSGIKTFLRRSEIGSGIRAESAATGCRYCGSVVKEQTAYAGLKPATRLSHASAAASPNSPLFRCSCQSDNQERQPGATRRSDNQERQKAEADNWNGGRMEERKKGGF